MIPTGVSGSIGPRAKDGSTAVEYKFERVHTENHKKSAASRHRRSVLLRIIAQD